MSELSPGQRYINQVKNSLDLDTEEAQPVPEQPEQLGLTKSELEEKIFELLVEPERQLQEVLTNVFKQKKEYQRSGSLNFDKIIEVIAVAQQLRKELSRYATDCLVQHSQEQCTTFQIQQMVVTKIDEIMHKAEAVQSLVK